MQWFSSLVLRHCTNHKYDYDGEDDDDDADDGDDENDDEEKEIPMIYRESGTKEDPKERKGRILRNEP